MYGYSVKQYNDFRVELNGTRLDFIKIFVKLREQFRLDLKGLQRSARKNMFFIRVKNGLRNKCLHYVNI